MSLRCGESAIVLREMIIIIILPRFGYSFHGVVFPRITHTNLLFPVINYKADNRCVVIAIMQKPVVG